LSGGEDIYNQRPVVLQTRSGHAVKAFEEIAPDLKIPWGRHAT
jgi:hypothetical protein